MKCFHTCYNWGWWWWWLMKIADVSMNLLLSASWQSSMGPPTVGHPPTHRPQTDENIEGSVNWLECQMMMNGDVWKMLRWWCQWLAWLIINYYQRTPKVCQLQITHWFYLAIAVMTIVVSTCLRCKRGMGHINMDLHIDNISIIHRVPRTQAYLEIFTLTFAAI